MTAVNLIVSATAAHLVTDAAYYDEQDVVCDIASKVAYSDRLCMAVAVSGSVTASRIANALAIQPDQDAALAALPSTMRALRDENAARQARWEGGGQDLNAFQCAVAIYSHRHGRPVGFLISTNGAWPAPGSPAYRLTAMRLFTSPPSGFVPTTDRFQPADDGRALLTSQRRSGCVGGFGELTTVTAEGVQQQRLVAWADRIGEVIATMAA